jgi:hypothetical protein
VNGVVCPKSNRDQVVRIKETGIPGFDLLDSYGIQMVNVETLVNLITFDTQITTVVPNDDLMSSLTPFAGCVKVLIDPTIEPERYFSDSTFE